MATAPVPAMDALLGASRLVVVPGIARWLGWTQPEPDESVDSYEAYLEQLSQEAA